MEVHPRGARKKYSWGAFPAGHPWGARDPGYTVLINYNPIKLIKSYALSLMAF